MKFMITFFLAFAIVSASFAKGPGNSCKRKKQSKTAKSERKLRRVVDANPQHAGYPKADTKGNLPSHYNEHTFYL